MNTQQLKQLEKDLWSAADNLRANTGLKSSEYATPILGLIFLKFADNRYARAEQAINDEFEKLQGTRREKAIEKIAIAKCGFYLPDYARYAYLLNLSEQEDVAKKIKEAMLAIEKYKPALDGVLPTNEYIALTRTDKSIPAQLLKSFSDIPHDASGDLLGKIYEYFLGKFALAEGQGGGEFFTPTSVVQLMVEIIEPYQGKIYDPACGSGGMFVQSHYFVEQQQKAGKTKDQLYVYGQEKTLETVKLAKMNLAVNGLRGEIKEANSYADNPFNGLGKFDFVLANPPFNVDDVPIATIEHDARFNRYGIPRKKTKVKKSEIGNETVTNANYLWISLFATSLTDKGRAALVMANSASDARHSEADIRRQLIEENLIYGMLTLPSNLFYTVTLPATLWFFDKNKADDKVLFIDARHIFTQIDRAHRKFNAQQIQNIALISKLHKGKRDAFVRLIDHYFAQGMEQLHANERYFMNIGKLFFAGRYPGYRNKIKAKTDGVKQYAVLESFMEHYQSYKKMMAKKEVTDANIDAINYAQQEHYKTVPPLFKSFDHAVKRWDKAIRSYEKTEAEVEEKTKQTRFNLQTLKRLKVALDDFHQGMKKAERYYQHIHWLQERFPKAKYDDVTGLCKLATQEEIKEQDYSLNAGRYVGVVIEEDGKTEEEFTTDLLTLNLELEKLNKKAQEIGKVINANIQLVTRK